MRRAATTLVTGSALIVGSLSGAVGPAAATAPTWAGAGAALPANAAPGNVSQLIGTSCAAPGNCVAVGSYDTSTAQEGLVDIQHDGSWAAAEAPLPADADVGSGAEAELINVSCPQVGSCVAVGFYVDTEGRTEGLVLSQHGSSWSAAAAPLPAGADTTHNSAVFTVDCWAAGACAASGLFRDTADKSQGLLLVLDDGSWLPTEAPLPGPAASNPLVLLWAISCGAPGSCVAAGYYQSAASNESAGLIERLDGGTWTTAAAAAPGADSIVAGVSCPSAALCIGVGAYSVNTESPAPFIDTVTPGGVTSDPVPLPADAVTGGTEPANLLASVSCPTTSYCAAVGTYSTEAGQSPLVETYAGGRWSPDTPRGSPLDPSLFSALYGVSCSWPGSCTAAGVSGPPGGTTTTGVVETLADGTWTQSTALLPANAYVPTEVFLGDSGPFLTNVVSCTGGACALAGSYAITADEQAGFLNTYPNLSGYQLAASDGGLFAYNAPFYGSSAGSPLNQPVVGLATVPDTGGYYEVAADGGVFAFHAPFYGSTGGTHLNAPIVGMAFDSRTGGYYEVASDGGVFAFNAPFYGSMAGAHLNRPIVGIAFDPRTGGYYEVAGDGGVFAFNAPFLGSAGNISLNKPVVGMAVDTGTGGYYEVASDGGLFAFDAPFQGSMGGAHLNKPVVGMAYDFITGGYYEVASDGGIFAFGAPFQGSTGSSTLNKPVVGMGFG